MENQRRYFAHTKEGCGPEDWQLLEEHLRGVALRAKEFAGSFGAGEWGYLAGLWHDLGKYSKAFQDYLRNSNNLDVHRSDSARKTDHSSAGAQHAAASLPILGHLLAYAIAGHHAGLLDAIGEGASMAQRLSKAVETWADAPDRLTQVGFKQMPPALQSALDHRDGFAISLFVRMIFSCLVDADFLDTEAFVDPVRAAGRPSWPNGILRRMEQALDERVRAFGSAEGEVYAARRFVREACIAAADKPPGLFSLTVPTGGGKTLASLAFALRHARNHGMHRVVYVIPFTSIIEQNAGVFREIFRGLSDEVGKELVLEHHSNFDPAKETTRSRLATENWDVPLVVTTSVQFYESLFSNRTSRCRKLHNLVGSVIILDEAQTLPVDFLKPCLGALGLLAKSYGATVVLCTATQPAVLKRGDFAIGLDSVREIISDPQKLYINLKRVEVEDLGPLTDDEVSNRVLEHRQVLCIVNTRYHARVLFENMKEREGIFHLSAQMCPEHRSEVLSEIYGRLSNRADCVVISTQLIEAGVDVDFPVVFRSMAGVDSIAQAAGRCNRNGGLADGGRTYVFTSEHVRAERFFSKTAGAGAQILELYGDPLSLEAIEHFFRLYYWSQEGRWDRKKILDEFCLDRGNGDFPFLFNFMAASRNFRLIEDTGSPVIIPWGKTGRRLCDDIRRCFGLPDRRLLRRLQRYTIQVPQRIWIENVGRTIENVHDRYPILISPETNYNDATGLNLEAESTNFLEV